MERKMINVKFLRPRGFSRRRISEFSQHWKLPSSSSLCVKLGREPNLPWISEGKRKFVRLWQGWTTVLNLHRIYFVMPTEVLALFYSYYTVSIANKLLVIMLYTLIRLFSERMEWVWKWVTKWVYPAKQRDLWQSGSVWKARSLAV